MTSAEEAVIFMQHLAFDSYNLDGICATGLSSTS
jgi:hypothetical protein